MCAWHEAFQSVMSYKADLPAGGADTGIPPPAG